MQVILYHGEHIFQKEGKCCKKEIIQGITSGQQRRGRQRKHREVNITERRGLKRDLLVWSDRQTPV